MIEEIRTKFLNVFNKAKEKMGEEISGWNKVFQFEISGLEPFYIEFKGGEANVVQGKAPNALATLSMDLDVLNQILDLQMDPMVAFMRGKMKITGNVMETVHLRKIFQVVREE